MAISYPRTDIMSAVDWSTNTTPLQLVSRQEQSRLASGKTIGKDLGPALWQGTFSTAPMLNVDALAFEAMLNSLDGVLNAFEAGDMRAAAQYPRAYPTGNFNDTGTLLSVNANNKALALTGLDAGMQISAGCYLSFDYGSSRALHQVMESVTANGSGVTTQFEVRPYIRAGYTLTSAVKLKQPRGIFVLLPGSVSSKLDPEANASAVTFQAIQNLS